MDDGNAYCFGYLGIVSNFTMNKDMTYSKFVIVFGLLGMILYLTKFNKIVMLIILMLLQYVDIRVTSRLSKKEVFEQNPLGKFWQKKFGKYWFIPAGILFLVIAPLILTLEKELITFFIGMYWSIVGNNLMIESQLKNVKK